MGKTFGLEPEGPKYLFQLKTARNQPEAAFGDKSIAPAATTADGLTARGLFAREEDMLVEGAADGIAVGAHGGVGEGAPLPGFDIGAAGTSRDGQ